MNFAICGDSFLSRSNAYPGSHFGELLSKKINGTVTYYSSPGMSNASICAQIDQAITNNHDLVIFNSTFSGRIEIPYVDIEEQKYDKKHIASPYWNDFFDDYTRLLSIPLNVDWRKQEDHLIARLENKTEKIDALYQYVNYLYKDSWKKQTDTYLLMGIIKKLELAKIRYIWCHDMLESSTESFDWVDSKNDSRSEFKQIYKIVGYVPMYDDPGYHTLPKHQHLLCEIIQNKL